jgi:hypothetical protein
LVFFGRILLGFDDEKMKRDSLLGSSGSPAAPVVLFINK